MPFDSDNAVGFAATVSKGLTPPEPGGGGGKDLPDGFPMNTPGTFRLVDTSKEPEKIPGGYEYDFTAHYKGFLVYRHWSTCARCQQAVATGEVLLPADEGDLECPHTQVKAYLEARQAVLDSKALCDPPQQVVLKDGSVVITFQWYTYQENHKKRRQMRKEARANGSVT